MRFTPILFSTPMVLAILDGRKTQTRRIIKPKYSNTDIGWKDDKYGRRLVERQNDVPPPEVIKEGKGVKTVRYHVVGYREIPVKYKKGDVLWVRETWRDTDFLAPEDRGYIYKASENGQAWADSDDEWTWRPSIFMPKDACRIFLQITDIRVERVQSITEADAIAEGVSISEYPNDLPVPAFAGLWMDINGEGSWVANPWVWVVSFTRIDKPSNFK